MANAGWTGNDNRAPGGPHDERQPRPTYGQEYCFDVCDLQHPMTLTDALTKNWKGQTRGDSENCDIHEMIEQYPVDGNSNSGGEYVPAAYPPFQTNGQ